jgi:hypothetical protein
MNNQDSLNDELLEKRIEKFYGYGDYEGQYWFIGMEEAGGDFKDVNHRLNIWGERECREIDDVVEYHRDLGLEYSTGFQLGGNLQPTWKGLIRILLSIKCQENIHLDDVRNYQIYELGRKDKETCLLELLPLPSPSINYWIYGKHSSLSYLCCKKKYIEYCIDKRINHISQRIKEYKPKVVVFYGMGYEYSWRKIADFEFTTASEGVLIGTNSQTVFAIVKHPVARGLTNEYFHNIGRLIAEKLT